MEFKPIKKIFIPFDFSSNSRMAFEYAAAMSERINSRILIHHVCKVPIVSANEYVVTDLQAQIATDVKTEMEQVILDLKKDHPGVMIEKSLSTGLIVDEIINASASSGADMIVMGTRGAHGIGSNVFGSNTASVIGKSSIPVLAVPLEAKYKSFSRVVFATSFLENDFQTLFQLTELLKPFNPEIEVLHVEERGEQSVLDQLMKDFSSQVKMNIPYKHISFKLIEGHNIEHALEEYVESRGVDLLAVASRRKNFFERFTESSMSRKLAFHTRIPLLVFHSFNKTSYPLL